MKTQSALIEAAELQPLLPHVRMLDATYGVPDARGGFARAHIGDAQFFDIDAVADPSAPYPHTLPSVQDFAAAAGAMGISEQDDIVIYDQNGISFAAARAWWMFRVMGHKGRVRVLNGGLPAWLAAGLPVQNEPAPPIKPRTYEALFMAGLYRDFDAMEEGRDHIIDARSAARFHAQVMTMDGDPTPAHLPDSTNLPFDTLLEPGGQRMKGADALASILFPHITPGRNLAVTCGSGVTACVLALGFHEAGLPEVAVYDGSWTEWSDRNGLR